MWLYWPLLALRSRHAAFFTAANPGIATGGFGFESKFDTLLQLPKEYCPNSVFAPHNQTFEDTLLAIRKAGISFPLIAKPDVGFRGLLVRKIKTPDELREYLQRYQIDFIIQEFLRYPQEVGIFYYRYPGQSTGHISSVTLKEFLHVIGDGNQSVLELVEQSPRAILQLRRLRSTHGDRLDYVPADGEKVQLGNVGNHNKGTLFLNGNDLIDEDLVRAFDKLCERIDGFYYGRFDIKCESIDQLKEGCDFKIMELNGVFAEPTHIYDPSQVSYWEALGSILKHWRVVYRIAAENRRAGVKPMNPLELIRRIRTVFRYTRRIRAISRKRQDD